MEPNREQPQSGRIQFETSLSGERTFQQAVKAAHQAMNHMRTVHPSTYMHSMSVQALTQHFLTYLARSYGLTDRYINEVSLAAMTHDIGKMGVPESIISARHPLTDAEFRLMHSHDMMAAQYLPNPHTSMQMEVALDHHKNWQSISPAAQFVAVADVFSALTEVRSYKRTFSLQEAIDTMLHNPRQSNLNPVLVEKMGAYQLAMFQQELQAGLALLLAQNGIVRHGQIALFRFQTSPKELAAELLPHSSINYRDSVRSDRDCFDLCGFDLYPGMEVGLDTKTNEVIAYTGSEWHGSMAIWRMAQGTGLWVRDRCPERIVERYHDKALSIEDHEQSAFDEDVGEEEVGSGMS
jgi:hypothetical protein